MAVILVNVRLNLKPMLAILVDSMVDTMVVLLPDTLVDMAVILVSVRLNLKPMLDILVDSMVDILVTVDSMVDMLATGDSFGKHLYYRRADHELFPSDELCTSHFVLNKFDTKKCSFCYIFFSDTQFLSLNIKRTFS